MRGGFFFEREKIMNDEKIRMVPMRESDANAYLETIERLEPNISPIDASAFYGSVAISLKRIADLFEAHEKRVIEFYAERDKPKDF
jgi:hypothetical protein